MSDFEDIMEKKIENWKTKLIDLSKRNNLISYRFTKSRSIKIESPEFSLLIEDLENEDSIRFSKRDESEIREGEWLGSEEEEIIAKKLYNIYLKARENFNELGIRTCFISLGVLNYKEVDYSDIIYKAPIVLCPAEIERLSSLPRGAHRFDITPEIEDVLINPALIEKLSNDHGLLIRNINEDETVLEYLEYFKEEIKEMNNWNVSEEIYLDVFSYMKFVMYQDICMHKDQIKTNELLRAYMGDPNALHGEISEFPRDGFNDALSIDVLPADSSQKRSIELSKSGSTFVLQGPPGTGKSQTICNIIAALIANQKKVLFVSQKKAALDVVLSRLKEIGLERYCLNLHSYKGQKKLIVSQFMDELETSPNIKSSEIRYSFTAYLNHLSSVNNYYKFLCEEGDVRKLSIYDIRGEIAKLYDVPMLFSKLENCLSYDEELFSALNSKNESIDYILEQVSDPLNNTYYNYKLDRNTILERNEFSRILNITREYYDNWTKYLNDFNQETGFPVNKINDIKTIDSIQGELNPISTLPNYILSESFFEIRNVISSIYQSLTDKLSLQAEIAPYVDETFLSLNVENYRNIFYNTGFFGRLLNKEYKKAKNELKEYGKQEINHSKWKNILDLKIQYDDNIKEHNNYVSENPSQIAEIKFHEDYEYMGRIKNISDIISKIYRDLSIISDVDPLIVIKYLFNNKQQHVPTDTLYDNFDEINQYFDHSQFDTISEIEEINRILDDLTGDYNKLEDILRFKKIYESSDDEIKKFISLYLDEKNEFSLKRSFLKSYYMQLLDSVTQDNYSPAPKLEIRHIKEKDFETRDIQRKKIMASVEKNQPKFGYESYGQSEVQILKRESQKKRRLKPIRDLLVKIPNLAFSLKPCWMMSPLSISQYIQPEHITFDVVIFDEASQIMPEDAVPCLLRAKQAIVMGDTQQLPPTTFFLKGGDDDNVEEEIEDLESFLSEASTRFRSETLDWHYRSKNETLIAFSNRYFYNNRLITFPNPDTEDEMGVDFIHVKNGVYDRGRSRTNRIEAAEVVKTYLALLKEHPKQSFGIIAFSRAQEKAIREAFQSIGVDPDGSIDSPVEDLFIKNLETVQGDERDIILISVGYGRDEAGKLSYHFGPINREGGYKRLNVAITRSRYRTLVISSILPEELDEDRINVDGVRYLKYYLDYAKNKNFTKYLQTSTDIGFDSGFEEAVYDVLIREGHEVSSQVGCSGYRIDLAIKHPERPGEYILGVECDGAQYHSSKWARDRDKVRQHVLEGLGWNIHRIWSEDWVKNRENEIRKINEKVEQILSTLGPQKKRPNEKFQEIEEINDFIEGSLSDNYQKYEVCELSHRLIKLEYDQYDRLNNSSHKRLLKKYMKDVILKESPIEDELIYRRILSYLGIGRRGRRIKKTLTQSLNEVVRENKFKINGKTISKNKINITDTPRISVSEERPFDLIPKEEIAGAIVDILTHTMSIPQKGIVKDIGKGIFSYNRTGKKIEEKITESINHLMKNRVIQITNGKIMLVNNNA